MMIPLFKPYMPEDISEDVAKILNSGKLVFDKYGRLFEDSLKDYLKNDKVVTVSSHFVALQMALVLLDVKEGDEVIMSPMGCLRSTQPVVISGAKVIFVDIDPNTGTIDPNCIRAKITNKTKVIINNHHLGYVGYIDEINNIGKEFGLYIIDDCVDGIGGIYKGNKVGNCGTDITVFSFDAVRLPNTIDGGAIVFYDEILFKKAQLMRDLGVNRTIYRDVDGEISSSCDVTQKGFQAKLSEINSFLGYKQMECLDGLLIKRRENASLWEHRIKDLEFKGIKSLTIVDDSVPNYWTYGVLSQNKKKDLEEFRKIGYYASGVHFDNSKYSLFGNKKDFLGVNQFYNSFLALPCGWWMSHNTIIYK